MTIKLSDLPPALRQQAKAQLAQEKPPRRKAAGDGKKPAVSAKYAIETPSGELVRVDSAGEVAFYEWCKRLVLPLPLPHWVLYFDGTFNGPKHEFDYLFPSIKLLVEVQGGAGTPHMGHTSKEGMTRDYTFWAEATILGYTVQPITTEQALNGDGARLVRRILNSRGFHIAAWEV